MTNRPFSLSNFRINLFTVIGSSHLIGFGEPKISEGTYDYQLQYNRSPVKEEKSQIFLL